MDHCYSQSLKTHAKGTPESVIQSLPTMYDAQVETYSGKMAGTQECYVLWIRALEQLGASINQYSDVVFNLSENAAFVSSIPYRPVNQVELPDLKPSVQHLIDRCICTDKIEDLKVLRTEIRTAKRCFRQIHKLCRISSNLIDQMYPSGATESENEPAEKLDRVEGILESRFSALMKLIRVYAAPEFFSVQRPSGFEGMTLEERELWIRQYYQIIESVASSFILMLNDLSERLQNRLLEYLEPQNFDELMQYWEKDGTPGRILRYFSPAETTDPSVRHDTGQTKKSSEFLPITVDTCKFVEAANVFLEQVAMKQTVLAKKLKSHNDNISHNIRSLLFLFNSGNSTDLKVLISNLSNVSWPANVLSAFCQGLVCELDKDPVASVASYQQVVELCGARLESEDVGLDSVMRILEESLVRMTQNYLSMKDHASACTALGMLSEMLPRYVTSYAKLLKLTGNAEFAIDLLKLYIENFPYEWRAATVLADTYEHIGRHDEAANAISISQKMRADVKQVKLNRTKKAA
jgi:tetratricopeptide (TPR) repeat protein